MPRAEGQACYSSAIRGWGGVDEASIGLVSPFFRACCISSSNDDTARGQTVAIKEWLGVPSIIISLTALYVSYDWGAIDLPTRRRTSCNWRQPFSRKRAGRGANIGSSGTDVYQLRKSSGRDYLSGWHCLPRHRSGQREAMSKVRSRGRKNGGRYCFRRQAICPQGRREFKSSMPDWCQLSLGRGAKMVFWPSQSSFMKQKPATLSWSVLPLTSSLRTATQCSGVVRPTDTRSIHMKRISTLRKWNYSRRRSR